MQRHTVPHFNPKSTIAIIHEQNIIGQQLSVNAKSELIDRYLDVMKFSFYLLIFTIYFIYHINLFSILSAFFSLSN